MKKVIIQVEIEVDGDATHVAIDSNDGEMRDLSDEIRLRDPYTGKWP